MEFFTFAWVTDPTIWLSLVTLMVLEIILGIDNLVFIAILTNRLPEERRPFARKVGLGLALGTRLMLLATLAWVVTLTQPLFKVMNIEFSWRDLILIGGGIFLLVKGTHEIHNSIECPPEEKGPQVYGATFGAIVTQIAIIDIIFSLDYVITAVGMVDDLWVMVVAVVVAMIIMLIASNPLANFVNRHPTVKMLALSFLLMIGIVLVADGLHFHIPKGYIYFSLAFAITVEGLNLWARSRRRKARAAAAAP